MDETSGQLGIPRPTLYRYLREYSIPSVKKSGRISIPEDSFEKIRHARDLHKEGLGTEAVRMRMSGAANTAAASDTGEIAVKLDRLSRDLESLKGDPKSLEEASSPHALRTILARQSLLMSSVFNLTDMVETLLRSTGQPRPGYGDGEVGSELRGANGAAVGIEGSQARLARSRPGGHEIRLSSPSNAIRSERSERGFGSLATRRRRGGAIAAGVLAVLLVLAILFLALSGTSSDTGAEDAAPPADTRQTIRVPDLSGLTYPEAETRLDEAGLAIEERESREGEVVGQNPEPDAEANDGDTVSVTLESDGENTESPADSQYGDDEFEFTE